MAQPARVRGSSRGVAMVVGLAAVAVAAAVGIWRNRGSLVGEPPAAGARRAVIVDQLDLTAPGAAFVAEARRTLEASGYAIDVVPALGATVEALRDLPSRRADVIVLRMHGARIATGNRVTDDVALFTGEPVDLEAMPMVGLPPPVGTAVAEARAAHAAAQSPAPSAARPVAGRDGPRFSADELRALVPMVYAVNGRELPYIGLRPAFIADHTVGRFADGTVIVLMGCDTVRSPALAEAFRARGAAVVIGWDGAVSAAHTDAATLALLVRWTASVAGPAAPPDAARAAVDAVNAELGPDPASGARLVAVGGA